MKQLIIASTSRVYGSDFLSYLLPELRRFFNTSGELIFIPYARPGGISHDQYTDSVQTALRDLGMQIKGLHEFEDPEKAIRDAEGIFTGGGNSFVLLKQLIENELIDVIREAVEEGVPYLGTSAGSNITGPDIRTTNDMPIVHPTSLKTLDLVPFNLNPHYLDPDPGSTHQGETRATRILEFHAYNDRTVIGLREGSWIEVIGERALLCGPYSARIFKPGENPYELSSGIAWELKQGVPQMPPEG